MGPQLYRCGNLVHALIYLPRQNSLQWGRNFIVAEMPQGYPAGRSQRIRFNGAATLSLRKLPPTLHQIFRETLLQWGRNFIVAEMELLRFRLSTIPKLQWGRNFIVAEIRQARGLLEAHTRASMGPQLYRCGNTGQRGTATDNDPASMGPQLYRCGNGTLGPIIGSDYD